MYICFAEYRIDPQYRDAYMAYTDKLVRSLPHPPVIYEGTDQPSLFVELWEAASEEAAGHIKDGRCSDSSTWRTIDAWVQGGRAKVHVWTFRPAVPSGGFGIHPKSNA